MRVRQISREIIINFVLPLGFYSQLFQKIKVMPKRVSEKNKNCLV